ncbi:metal-nicotianamine transporter YSL [Salix suchowensis]|nr:metal-nicotianamine transporter YSL [Salix suchowensis]
MNMNMEEMKEIERAKGEDTEEITARGIVASVATGIIYSVIVMKLNLTTGLVPNFNVSAALLAFAGIVTSPFTRQENTIVQTCAVACYSIATYEQAGVDTEGNTPGSTKEHGIGWMTGFLFESSFVGLLALVPLRKVMFFLHFS